MSEVKGGMAEEASGSTLPSKSTTEAAAQILRENLYWNDTLGLPVELTYGFRSTPPAYSAGESNVASSFQRFNDLQKTAAQVALALWSDVANLTFVPVKPDGFTDDATMLFGNFLSGPDFAFAALPETKDRSPRAYDGDVWMNGNEADIVSAEGLFFGGYGIYTFIHEIGHALGLSHPGDYNDGDGDLSYELSAVYREDSRQYTVMSYFGAGKTGADHEPAEGLELYAFTPLLHDIAAMQRLYGANMATRTGDTVYGFNSNADRSIYRLGSPEQERVLAIWDAGGLDTLDFSGYAQNQVISLWADSFSSVGSLTQNWAIAQGVTIEQAKGGSGADVISGNDVGNALWGNGGDDTLLGFGGDDYLDGGTGWDWLDGGEGIDEVGLSGRPGQYWSWTSDALRIADRQAGTENGVALTSVETAKFYGAIYNGIGGFSGFSSAAVEDLASKPFVYSIYSWLALPEAPSSYSTAASVFETADFDWAGVWGYLVYDGTAGGAYFELDGSRLETGAWQWVSAADWSRLNIRASAGEGESLQVIANVGGTWTDNSWVWVQGYTPAAPTVTAQWNVELTDEDETVLVSDLFSIDGQGLPVDRYQVRDAVGGGALQLDGEVLRSGRWLTLDAEEFARLEYQPGQEEDELDVRVATEAGRSRLASRSVKLADWSPDNETIARLGTDSTAYGTVGFEGDHDWIRLDLAAGDYEFELSGAETGGGTLERPALWLRGAKGYQEAFAQEAEGEPARFTYRVEAAGTYYLDIGVMGDDEVGTYSVAVARRDPDAWAAQATAQLAQEAAPTVAALAGNPEGATVRNELFAAAGGFTGT